MLLDLSPYTEPLARTPRILRAVIEGQPDAWLDSRHAADVVSPREAVAHLVLGDRESWVLRIRRVLTPEEGIPRPTRSDAPEAEILAEQTVYELLAEFELLRPQRIQELLDLNLTSSDLEKQAVHSKFGPYSAGNLLAAWVAHDLYHLGQIFKSYASQFADEIGSWQYYLNLPHFN
jgi:DinB family protein